MKARLYYFNKKTQKRDERAFDKLYRDLDCVSRSNDPSKLLADNALRILSNLIPMLLASKNKMICINQDFFSDITGKGVDQNSNLLKQLKDIINCKYHRMVRFEGKRYNYCYIIEFSDDGEKRVSNPELFYTIDSKINLVRRGKKFGLIAEKIRPSYKDIREIKREKEEEPKGYSSSFSRSTPIARAREAEIVQISFGNAPQDKITEIPTLATGYPTEPAKVYQTKEIRVVESEVVTNCDRLGGFSPLRDTSLLTNLLIPSTDFGEIKNPAPTTEKFSIVASPITEKQEVITPMKNDPIPRELQRNMELELSSAIFKNFGGVKSDELMENCKFIPINENKLGVQVSNGFRLSQTDRDRLKDCIRLVYGDGINIISSAVLKIAGLDPEILVKPESQQYYHKWTQFRNDLRRFLPDKTGDHSLNAWFDKFRVSEDLVNDRIILTGSRFYVDSVYNRFQTAIEHVTTKNKVTLELHFENNDEKPIIYKPNGGF